MTRAEAVTKKLIHDAETAKTKSEKAALELSITRGEYIRVEAAQRQADQWTARVVAGLGAIPSRVAVACPSLPPVALAAIRTEIERVRRDLANDDIDVNGKR